MQLLGSYDITFFQILFFTENTNSKYLAFNFYIIEK